MIESYNNKSTSKCNPVIYLVYKYGTWQISIDLNCFKEFCNVDLFYTDKMKDGFTCM